MIAFLLALIVVAAGLFNKERLFNDICNSNAQINSFKCLK